VISLLVPLMISTQTGAIDLGGTGLKYVIEGQGTPCLVIGSSVYYPRTFSKNLRKHFRFHFVDMRWFAARYQPVELANYTIETLVNDIETVRTKLKLDKFVLVGHSIHGTVAFEYAKRHPRHVSRLVMIGSPVVFGNPEYEKATADAWETASTERKRLQSDNWQHPERFTGLPQVALDYLAMAPKYWFNPRYDARWLWEGMTIQSPMIQHLYGTLFANYRMFSPGDPAPVPTFVAAGTYDYVIPLAQWKPFATVRGLTLETFGRSGHTPQLEQPAEFDRRLLAWMKHH